jgi:cytochrome c
MKLVPGTRMTYSGQTDPAKRKAIIAYLKTLK